MSDVASSADHIEAFMYVTLFLWLEAVLRQKEGHTGLSFEIRAVFRLRNGLILCGHGHQRVIYTRHLSAIRVGTGFRDQNSRAFNALSKLFHGRRAASYVAVFYYNSFQSSIDSFIALDIQKVIGNVQP